MADLGFQGRGFPGTVHEAAPSELPHPGALIQRLVGPLEPVGRPGDAEAGIFGSVSRELGLKRLHELAAFQRVLFQDWTVELCYLLDSFKILRFSELQRKMRGISTRTLSGRLAALQQLGFVRRRLLQTIPPHVEYRLTAQGSVFVRLLEPLLQWLESIRSAIMAIGPTTQSDPPQHKMDRPLETE